MLYSAFHWMEHVVLLHRDWPNSCLILHAVSGCIVQYRLQTCCMWQIIVQLVQDVGRVSDFQHFINFNFLQKLHVFFFLNVPSIFFYKNFTHRDLLCLML